MMSRTLLPAVLVGRVTFTSVLLYVCLFHKDSGLDGRESFVNANVLLTNALDSKDLLRGTILAMSD